MSTNLAIDDTLINEVVKIGHHKNKKQAVTIALSEYIQRRKQMAIIESFGIIDYDPSYDYKKQRKIS